VLFFDLSSMQDEDIDRAVEAATKYVKTQMQPADLVALVSMSTGLTMDQDFTSNKDALLRGLGRYNGTDETGFANGTTGSTSGTADDTSAFAADDTEYNSLNTDRELLAIRTIAKSLERVDQRKSMLYFSGGLTRNGIENEASLRAATNEAAKANMAIYSVDTRGLQALPPVGDASSGSLRGNSAYSGASATAQVSANFGSQETLDTLSLDTGGKSFMDSNDFAPAFQQVQHDTEAYYILGFRSTNQRQDGSYRHLTVKVNRDDVKIEYRPGYYAGADFQHQKTEDREEALTEQMRSDLPATDVAV
jgi:VWFA-related protein